MRRGAGGLRVCCWPDRLLVKKQVLGQNLRLPHAEVFFRGRALLVRVVTAGVHKHFHKLPGTWNKTGDICS